MLATAASWQKVCCVVGTLYHLHCCSTSYTKLRRILGAMGAILHTSKFIRLQRHKHPTSVPLMMLLGHCNCSQVCCVRNAAWAY